MCLRPCWGHLGASCLPTPPRPPPPWPVPRGFQVFDIKRMLAKELSFTPEQLALRSGGQEPLRNYASLRDSGVSFAPNRVHLQAITLSVTHLIS